jgi:hypothetical protein
MAKKKPLEDWAVLLSRRVEDKPKERAVPTKCPACSSDRIRVGGHQVKCLSCRVITSLRPQEITDAGRGVDIGELQELRKQYGGDRGIERQ